MTAGEREVVVDLENSSKAVIDELKEQRLTRDVYSPAQLREIMTDFWLNHFNVYLHKNEETPYYLVSFERDVIRPRALDKFEDLLVATAESPAMLLYLDNASSMGPESIVAEKSKERAQKQNMSLPPSGLNENYARELMELHTLGVDGGYPATPFGTGMKQIAQLMKAKLGVEAAFTDIGGWETHHNQGGVNGDLANRLKDFSEGISAFWRDLGDDAEKITLVTMSEFGRTAEQNGTGGTDHGRANVMFVLGGGVKGGKVFGKWPGLAREQLNESRDLAVTIDFRQVLAEAVNGTLGVTNLEFTFPGTQLRKDGYLGLI